MEGINLIKTDNEKIIEDEIKLKALVRLKVPFYNEPVKVQCFSCKKEILTQTKMKCACSFQRITDYICYSLICLPCLPVCIFYVENQKELNKIYHYCPECKTLLGINPAQPKTDEKTDFFLCGKCLKYKTYGNKKDSCDTCPNTLICNECWAPIEHYSDDKTTKICNKKYCIEECKIVHHSIEISCEKCKKDSCAKDPSALFSKCDGCSELICKACNKECSCSGFFHAKCYAKHEETFIKCEKCILTTCSIRLNDWFKKCGDCEKPVCTVCNEECFCEKRFDANCLIKHEEKYVTKCEKCKTSVCSNIYKKSEYFEKCLNCEKFVCKNCSKKCSCNNYFDDICFEQHEKTFIECEFCKKLNCEKTFKNCSTCEKKICCSVLCECGKRYCNNCADQHEKKNCQFCNSDYCQNFIEFCEKCNINYHKKCKYNILCDECKEYKCPKCSQFHTDYCLVCKTSVKCKYKSIRCSIQGDAGWCRTTNNHVCKDWKKCECGIGFKCPKCEFFVCSHCKKKICSNCGVDKMVSKQINLFGNLTTNAMAVMTLCRICKNKY